LQSAANKDLQSRLLWVVLLINLGFFLIEIETGLISGSMVLKVLSEQSATISLADLVQNLRK